MTKSNINKKKNMQGFVESDLFSEGSKSEHQAVYLNTGDKKYRLKIKDGNPFQDNFLDSLVGKNISAQGDLNDFFFVLDKDSVKII